MIEEYLFFDDSRSIDLHRHEDVDVEWDVQGGIFSIRWYASDEWVSTVYKEICDTNTFARYVNYSHHNTYIVEGLF